MPLSRLGCPLSLKTPNMGNPGLYDDFWYRAESWGRARRVVAKVEWHQGELFPRVGFIVTNMTAGPGTLDDLQDPARHGHHPVHQLAAVASVSPDESQAWESSYQFIDDQPRPISVLDIGRMHHHRQQQAHGIYDDVSLSTVDLLTSIIATRPPFSVVFTLWLSMIAALGVGFLPSASRTQGRSVSLTRSHVPSMVQLRKYLYRVCQGGRSCGTIRQGHPLRSKYRMPFTTSRRSTVRGRPPGLAGGSRGPRISHCSSVRSLGYDLRLIHQV